MQFLSEPTKQQYTHWFNQLVQGKLTIVQRFCWSNNHKRRRKHTERSLGFSEKGNVPGTGFGQFASNADSNAGLTQLSLRETSSRNGVDYEELFPLWL